LRWKRSERVWEKEAQAAGFAAGTVATAFVEDKSGNLWIATGSDSGDSRLVRYRNGNFRTFTEADGLPLGWTRDLYVDDLGRLWLANTEAGLLRLDDSNTERLDLYQYSIAEGLSSTAVYCVIGDAFGRIYAGTGRGIDRLTPTTGQIENFTTADGLPNSYVEVAYRDRNNQLWFATHDGLVRFQPEPPRLRTPPTVLITGVRVAGVQQRTSMLGEQHISQIELQPGQDQVSIDFIGLGATLGEKLDYEYRISDAGWEPTRERTVTFANLAAGTYGFEVRGITGDKLYSQPAVLSFRIAAPVWQRWWFLMLVSVLIAAVVYLVYRNRVAQLLEMEKVRTRIATDLHDDIGANLTRISILSEVAKQNATNGNTGLLTSIAEIARESVASMNDIVWAVSPQHDSLVDLTRRMRLHAEEVFSSRDVRLDFDAPQTDAGLKLSVGVRRDLLLIFKEAVSNAARHSDASEVLIRLEITSSALYLEVSDNGSGFDRANDGGGQGITSMSRRASAIGGQLTIDANPHEGTRVRLLVPR